MFAQRNCKHVRVMMSLQYNISNAPLSVLDQEMLPSHIQVANIPRLAIDVHHLHTQTLSHDMQAHQHQGCVTIQIKSSAQCASRRPSLARLVSRPRCLVAHCPLPKRCQALRPSHTQMPMGKRMGACRVSGCHVSAQGCRKMSDDNFQAVAASHWSLVATMLVKNI